MIGVHPVAAEEQLDEWVEGLQGAEEKYKNVQQETDEDPQD